MYDSKGSKKLEEVRTETVSRDSKNSIKKKMNATASDRQILRDSLERFRPYGDKSWINHRDFDLVESELSVTTEKVIGFSKKSSAIANSERMQVFAHKLAKRPIGMDTRGDGKMENDLQGESIIEMPSAHSSSNHAIKIQGGDDKDVISSLISQESVKMMTAKDPNSSLSSIEKAE